jgi:bifunctional DNase/RNase
MDVPMELSRILMTEYGDQQVIFLKEKGGDRTFPIVIGTYEAMAIDRRLKDRPTARPLTHDLLANVIAAMGGRLSRIVINDLRDHIFFATLYIERDGKEIAVDSRPSDAIALGAAFDTPIFVAEKVVQEALRDDAESRLEMLRQRLDQLRERIGEYTTRLADEDFLAHTPTEIIDGARAEIEKMRAECMAIEHILRKLS